MTQQLFNPLRYWSDRPEFMAAFDALDAELDREDSLSDRYAFQLGEGMGNFRLSALEQWPSTEMERGYQHGLSRPAKPTDGYVRKLMTLRRNAFARGIPVSSALTKEYLRRIAVTVCPVSGVDLTQGTMADTDWSVDRLDNSIGYVPGNICIVSSRVNQLKGSCDFRSLADEAQAVLLREGPDGFYKLLGNGLLVAEALRMAALMAAPSGFACGMLARYAPFAMAPSAWATMDSVVAGIHVECARPRIEGFAYSRRAALFKRLGSGFWRMSSRLVELVRSELARGSHPADVWFDGRTLTLLNQLTDEFMNSPPQIEGIDVNLLAQNMKNKVSPLGQYAR